MLLISATHKLCCYSNLSDGNKLVDISYLLTYVQSLSIQAIPARIWRPSPAPAFARSMGISPHFLGFLSPCVLALTTAPTTGPSLRRPISLGDVCRPTPLSSCLLMTCARSGFVSARPLVRACTTRWERRSSAVSSPISVNARVWVVCWWCKKVCLRGAVRLKFVIDFNQINQVAAPL